MNQKENLDHDACTILSDFAENYQYVIQDRFQSFHWNNSQGSITQLLDIIEICLYIIKMCLISFKRSHLSLHQKI